MVDKQQGLLEDFRALRQELLEVQKARVWGVLTYIIMTGGFVTVEMKFGHFFLYPFLILAALPFLWHTANRERSRVRIAAYIKAVVEPQVPGLKWEAHLEEWRKIAPAKTTIENIVDRWRYIFALTGVYVVIVVFVFMLLLVSPAGIVFKLGGALGIALCAESHWYLDKVLSSAPTYEKIFREASLKLDDSQSDTS